MAQKAIDRLMIAFDEVKSEVKRRNSKLYERWKAGGFMVSGDFVSMYPSIEEVMEELGEEDHDEEDEDEEDVL